MTKKRGGFGKRKGSGFEREVCKKLSLWVSHGEKADLFWRSAMSGGRATVALKRGEMVRQAGDICAVTPEGHVFTDVAYAECKHVRNIRLERFVLHGRGPIAEWWKTANKQATAHGREPVLIVRGNNMPILVFTRRQSMFNPAPVAHLTDCDLGLFERVLKTRFTLEESGDGKAACQAEAQKPKGIARLVPKSTS